MMQALLTIKCSGCGRRIGAVRMDTADDIADLGNRVCLVVLRHRKDCSYYGERTVNIRFKNIAMYLRR